MPRIISFNFHVNLGTILSLNSKEETEVKFAVRNRSVARKSRIHPNPRVAEGILSSCASVSKGPAVSCLVGGVEEDTSTME